MNFFVCIVLVGGSWLVFSMWCMLVYELVFMFSLKVEMGCLLVSCIGLLL